MFLNLVRVMVVVLPGVFHVRFKVPRLLKLFRRFVPETNGNVAMSFALAIVPMLLVTGAAVDIVRSNNAQSALQAATDAAALTAGSLPKSSSSKALEESIMANLTANGIYDAVDVVTDVEIDKISNSGSVRVTVTGKLKTSLMALGGVDTMDVVASAEVNRGAGQVEVALVLDSTLSMEGAKMDAMKTAARSLVDTIMGSGDNAKMGVVPFGQYVNVGVGHRGASWLTVPEDHTEIENQCTVYYPGAQLGACRQVTATWTQDGQVFSAPRELCDYNMPDGTKVCEWHTSDPIWRGCVGSRNYPLDTNISDPSALYRGLQQTHCPTALQPLTANKATVLASIDRMIPHGDTYTPAGLLWGWNVLSSAAPFTEGAAEASFAAAGGRKVIVLMSDGANNLFPRYPYHHGTGGGSSVPDGLTNEVCENAKSAGITIFTVLFDVTDPAVASLMRNCASEPSKAFLANDATALNSAFNEIGDMLTELRLTK
jgi:Flp pilus assembly protein TadG